MGVRPQGIFQAEPGEWPHGWQYCASSSSEHSFRKNVVLDQSCAADPAHLRSHSGPGASDALSVCPSKPEFRIEAGLFRTLILERLRLPLQVTEKVCECAIALDSTGRHRLRAIVQEDSRRGRWRQRGPWPGSAEKLEQQYVATRCSAIVATKDDRAIEALAWGGDGGEHLIG